MTDGLVLILLWYTNPVSIRIRYRQILEVVPQAELVGLLGLEWK